MAVCELRLRPLSARSCRARAAVQIRLHALGSWPLRALAFGERRPLTLLEILRTAALWEEEVAPVARFDEAEALVGQSFHGAFSRSEAPRGKTRKDRARRRHPARPPSR